MLRKETTLPDRFGGRFEAQNPGEAVWVCVPTYNEVENVGRLIGELVAALEPTTSDLHILVIDDNSPDGTADAVRTIAANDERIELLSRPVKEGIGPAYLAGFAYALKRGADLIVQMDCDFSHSPAAVPGLIAATKDADLVIGSRYVSGGRLADWGPVRRVISRGGCAYAQTILGVGVRDLTGGFKCLRRRVVERVLAEGVRAQGYAFQIGVNYLAVTSGFRVVEIPITFTDRTIGTSKMSSRIVLEAMLMVPGLRFGVLKGLGRTLLRFGLVGLSGYAVNLAVFAALVTFAGVTPLLAATGAFLVALLSNFVLNRVWTFGATTQRAPAQLVRYAAVSALTFLVSLGVLRGLIAVGIRSIPSQAIAIGASAPLNFILCRRWAFQATATTSARMIPDVPARGSWKILVRRLAVAVLALAGTVAVTRPQGAWLMLAAILFIVALAPHAGLASRDAQTVALSSGVTLSALAYLGWRVTVVNWHLAWIAVPLFLAELHAAIESVGMAYTLWPRRERVMAAREDPSQLPIFVLIPTVNEGVGIVEPTIVAAKATAARYVGRHPTAQIRIVVCNDGRVANFAGWNEIDDLAAQHGVECVTRTVPGGAKAGNIEHARQLIGAVGNTLLVIFDADQIAAPVFLETTIAPFANPAMGWVQSGQYYSNLDNPVARWADHQQAIFYTVLCPGKSRQNAAFICGTNVVIRASALDEIGGFPTTSVTEDFAASIMLHDRWQSTFVPGNLAIGLGPVDLKSYFAQQRRWATGTLGVLRSHWKSIVLPWHGRLRFPQRIQYGLACIHYLGGLRNIVFLVAPLIFLFTGLAPVRGAYLSSFFITFLPYLILSQLAFWHAVRGASSIRGRIIGVGSAPALVQSVWAAFTPGTKQGFVVTPKRRTEAASWKRLIPHLVALALCVAGIVAAALAHNRDAAVVAAGWVAYTGFLLVAFLWLGYLDIRGDRGVARQPGPWATKARLRPLFIGAALFVPAAVGTSVYQGLQPSRARVFSIVTDKRPPYLGVFLPADQLDVNAVSVPCVAGIHVAIVGRRQEIGDQFDAAWSRSPAMRGARPWITLLFTKDGAANRASSLPAIANGAHDAALERWANELAQYGKPVYLTILQQVDRNWAPSSAVAGGGIPSDSARAWLHARSIFRRQGAKNVRWVWAPADPAHDARFAPPKGTIDVALISFVNYPHTTWPGPVNAMAAVARNHPGTPLFIEFTAAGPSSEKAEWINRIRPATGGQPYVAAIVYHEGGPLTKPTRVQLAQWASDSDPASRAALRRVAAELHVRGAAGVQRAACEGRQP